MIRKTILSLADFIRYSVSVMRCMRNSNLLKTNSIHCGAASGEVYILCTGSSLRGKNLGWLKGKDLIATNLFCLSDQYDQLDITHYSMIEPWNYRNLTFLSFFADMIMLRRKQGSRPVLWLHASADHYINSKTLHYDYFSASLLAELDIRLVSNRGDFSSDAYVNGDLATVCNVAMGATVFNIFLAMYLGYKKIYLLGADYNKTPFQIGHCYDHWQHRVTDSELKEIGGYDYLELANKRSHKAIQYAKSNGVDILNVIDRGFSSPIFDSVYYDELSQSG